METKSTQCHPKPLENATCLLGEKGCYGNGKCHYIGNCENKVFTNADRIRAMSDEEIAKVPAKFGYSCVFPQKECGESDTCEKCLLEWLKQPAEDQ